jgi:hypothetical protein
LIKRLITFYIITVATVSFANDTDSCFNLKNYVPPAFNYNLLEITPHVFLDGTNKEQKTLYYNKSEFNTPRMNEDRNRYNGPTLGLKARHKYYGWKGKTEWQLGSDISFNGLISLGSPSLNRYSSTQQYYSSSRIYSGSVSGSTYVSNAHYFKWPFFIGYKISPSATGNLNNRKQIDKSISHYYDLMYSESDRAYRYDDEKSRYRSYSAGGDVNCRIGAGHIDDVSFAIAALNILDRIAATEKSYSGCSEKRIQNLSALIEKSRKRRIFDSRIGKIENIDTICKLITEMGITDSLTPRTVLEIADQWDYAFYQTRKNGFSIELDPHVKFSRNSQNSFSSRNTYSEIILPASYSLKINDDNEFNDNKPVYSESGYSLKSNETEYSLNLKAQYELPVSRYFQLGFNGNVSTSLLHNWNIEIDQTWNTSNYTSGMAPAIASTESVRFGYFPNTRTSLTISESINYYRAFDFLKMSNTRIQPDALPQGKRYDVRNLSANINLDATYYFSPQLLLSFTAVIHYQDSYGNSNSQIKGFYEIPYTNSSKEFSYQIGGDVVWGIF